MSSKTMIITGGFGSLGKATARVAIAQGYQVALVDMAEEFSDPELADSPQLLALGGVDVCDLTQACGVTERVVSHFGGISVLLNIAGGFRWESFEAGQLDTWGQLHHLNVTTAVTMSKAVMPIFLQQEQGSIVCVSAESASRAGVGVAAYAASKAGVSRFVESLAEEVKDRGVRVNAVAPSIIDTAPNREGMPDEDFSRWVSPSALAKAMLFLASDQAEAITGAVLPVSGRV